MDERRLIGAHGKLPWRLPNDLLHFKALTVGKIVLMGRKTWQSLSRPLPQRENWVLSRDLSFRATGASRFVNLDTALRKAGDREVMVIGGAEIYRQCMSRADRIELTQVHGKLEGDTWFPEIPALEWREVAREDHPADERHPYAYSFVRLERKRL